MNSIRKRLIQVGTVVFGLTMMASFVVHSQRAQRQNRVISDNSNRGNIAAETNPQTNSTATNLSQTEQMQFMAGGSKSAQIITAPSLSIFTSNTSTTATPASQLMAPSSKLIVIAPSSKGMIMPSILPSQERGAAPTNSSSATPQAGSVQ